MAWRQVYAYVDVMLELVESGERSIEEAFMADVGVNVDGQYRRLADVFRERGSGMLALPSGRGSDYELLE